MREGKMKPITAVAILLLAGCSRSTDVIDPPTVEVASGTVTIKIVGATETQSIEIPDVAQGTLLEAVMRSIKDVPIKIQGSGTTAFVDKIGDQATDSTDGWTFKIDDEFANQGIGSTSLSPPTTVTWRFRDFEAE
jgi:hypothetical protein